MAASSTGAAATKLDQFLYQPAIVPYPLTLAFAVLLGFHGYRSASLNRSGATAACILGYITLANPLKLFGVALLVFYFAGSRATKVKAVHKLSLEDRHTPEPTASASTPKRPFKAGGNRDAFQVACNALFGALCAITWRILYGGEVLEFSQDRRLAIWNAAKVGERWCVVDERVPSSRALVLAAIAFWACCAGDTLASELGILSSTPPRLITSLRSVPRGTNGGISLWGLFVSLLGGILIGFAAAISLAWENPECSGLEVTRIVWGGGKVVLSLPWWGWIVGLGAWGGLVGSLVSSFPTQTTPLTDPRKTTLLTNSYAPQIDSLLGATLQPSCYSLTRKKIVHSSTNPKDPQEEIIRVPGSGVAILSNNQVNLISSALTGSIVLVSNWPK
ncbi:BZ3500_MvSof-1268-A1-R1_Chr3-3g06491 [Microbotryum saponariae]|uniref:BZ3500_MvSof-1268-A1-R1_Chr3-3g06491 protein n=1 Tax=Microbotryum saponariae TaxID=289078 RepID=A0A2X0LHG7_9BASI|nr:BZ3500_MvSof-1268-A1-R1_Chr3-3g06491 [Microbotryum saponariae]SDA04458.1 BZ3501_MvSof-1269-A2-R1_Chr3-2g06178 [Microbotryum saponariae]